MIGCDSLQKRTDVQTERAPRPFNILILFVGKPRKHSTEYTVMRLSVG